MPQKSLSLIPEQLQPKNKLTKSAADFTGLLLL